MQRKVGSLGRCPGFACSHGERRIRQRSECPHRLRRSMAPRRGKFCKVTTTVSLSMSSRRPLTPAWVGGHASSTWLLPLLAFLEEAEGQRKAMQEQKRQMFREIGCTPVSRAAPRFLYSFHHPFEYSFLHPFYASSSIFPEEDRCT